eukprot:CFRG0710T1
MSNEAIRMNMRENREQNYSYVTMWFYTFPKLHLVLASFLLGILVSCMVFTPTRQQGPVNCGLDADVQVGSSELGIYSSINISDSYRERIGTPSYDVIVDSAEGWVHRYDKMKSQMPLQMRTNDLKGSHFFANNWEPVVGCEYEKKLGNPGDGGKWICNPYNIKGDVKDGGKKLVYSLGSRNDFSFETAVYEFFGGNVEIHTFDFGESRNKPDYVYYHQWGVGGRDIVTEDGTTFRTLPTIMTELGHADKQIDILKMDIDGAECDVIIPTIKNGWLQRVNQLQMEIHLRGIRNDPNSPSPEEVHDMMNLLRDTCNLEIFHKEPNINHGEAMCTEYAWVKVDWSKLAGVVPGLNESEIYRT